MCALWPRPAASRLAPLLGADVNGTFVTDFCEPEGTRWPIHAAAKNGHVNCLIELLVRGAEVHSWPLFGPTSELHLAARHGHVECVSTLLNFTAELRKTSAERISLVDEEGKTPLHIAAEHGHRGCIRELLRCGASTDATDECGNTPFELAVMNGHADAASQQHALLVLCRTDLQTADLARAPSTSCSHSNCALFRILSSLPQLSRR